MRKPKSKESRQQIKLNNHEKFKKINQEESERNQRRSGYSMVSAKANYFM